MPLDSLRAELKNLSNKKKAKVLQGFFKTRNGEYGMGSIFLGVAVPMQRKIIKKYFNLSLKEIQELLNSKIHEERLSALLILVNNYNKNPAKRKEIFDFYLDNASHVNNWDLVDLSSHHIVGHFLHHSGEEYPACKSLLANLAKSENLWERRISIISTFHFIKNNQFNDALSISKLLLKDKHDLIHKAVGWMLREIGKRDLKAEENFLKLHYKEMPRTMLRYAIERFPEKKRRAYLKGEK